MRAGASVDDPPSPARHLLDRSSRVPRRLRCLALLLPSAAALFALYLRQSLTGPVNSDGAANILQAQSILDGNPLLHGWWTSDVSFYTTELPEYALVTALHGVTPDVVHLCGALTYTLTVLLAAVLARGRTPGPPGWTRAALTAGIMLAPAILGGTEVYLENPDHAGTAAPVLLLLVLLDQAGDRASRWLPAAACALLAVAQVGDELTLLTAAAPLAAVCAVRLTAGRLTAVRLTAVRLTTGGLTTGRCARRRDAALLVAAVVSVGLARLASQLIRALGGFDRRPLAGVAPGSLSELPARASVLWRTLLLLFRASQPGTPRQPQTVRAHVYLVLLADLHVLGLVLGGAGLAVGAALVLSRRAGRVTAILVVAICMLLGAALFTTVLRSLSNAHEVALLLPLGAALAGRVLAPTLPGHRPAGRAAAGQRPAGRLLTVLPVLAAGTWLALNLAGLCYAATWPAAQQAQQPVAAWLTAHHQQEGLSGYWQASATTVAGGGRVTVAPVVVQPVRAAKASPARIRAEADRWESSASWYQPGTRDASFVIAVADPAAPGGGLSVATARACFGPPAAERQIGQDVIMLYRYNLLTRVAAVSFPGT